MKILAILLSALLLSPHAFAIEVGKVTYVEGRVDVLRPGSDIAMPLVEGEAVSVGDAVRTKSNSKAEIVFTDKSALRLAESTRVEIKDYLLDNKFRRKAANIMLDRGKARAIITKMPDSADFIISTPNAEGKVKGSDIFAFYQAGNSGMLVAEGRLSVASIAHPDKALAIPAGTSVLVPMEGLPRGPREYFDLEKKLYEQDTNCPVSALRKERLAVIKGAVSRLSGEVKIRIKDSGIFHDAKMEEVLGEGDRIETGASGMIEVRLDNGNAINLKPNTRVTLLRLVIDPNTSEYENLLEVEIGRLRARIENLKGSSSFKVKTPTAITGARGTILYVDVSQDSTASFFEGGNGFITNAVSGTTQDINAGYNAAANMDGAVSDPAATTADERMGFTEGWDAGNGTEGYSAPEGAAGSYLYDPATGTGAAAGGTAGDTGGAAGGGTSEPPNGLPFTESQYAPSSPTPPAYSLSGAMSGNFGSYREQDRRLDLNRGSLSGSFSASGSTSIWGGGSRSLAFGGIYMDSSSPSDRLWGGTFSGSTSDGAALLGFSGGIKGSLEGLLYAFYVRPVGGGHRTGYIKSTDLVGNFYPDAGVFGAAGTLTSHFDFATSMLPGNLYIGGPSIRWFGTPEGAGTGRVFGDGFTGSIFLDTTQIERQQQDTELWMAGLGGAWTSAPQGAWNAVFGGVDHWKNEDAYWITHLTGPAWQNGRFRGRVVSGRDIGYYRTPEYRYNPGSGSWTGTIGGDILGVYDGNGGWQAIGMGVFPPTNDLRFGAKFGGKFGHYDAESQKVVINYGSFTGILGGTASLWTGSPHLTILGEFSNSANDPLWHNSTDINGTTKDGGAFLAAMGGIKGSLEGLLYAFYIRPDGRGGYLAGYLKSTDITGEFYPGIGMFEADGTIIRSANEYGTQYLPSQLYDKGPALEKGSYFTGRISGSTFAANLRGEATQIKDQSWGLWRGDYGGTYQAAPTNGPWTADMGGASFGYVEGPVESYFIGTVSGDAWQNGEINGIVSVSSLSQTSFEAARNSGEHIGTYAGGIWQGLTIGHYSDEVLLTSSGRFVAQGWNTGAGSNFDFAGLIGLIGPIWSAGAHPKFISMGEFTPPDPNNPNKQFAWEVQKEWLARDGLKTDGFVSRYDNGQRTPVYTYTTYNDLSGVGNGIGSFYGLAAGVGGDGRLRGLVYSIYIDPLGRAGVLWGDVEGNYYANIKMYRLDSIPGEGGEGLDKNLYLSNIGILPENLRANISWDNLTGSPDGGGFVGSDEENEIGPVVSRFSGTMLNISQQTWGVWNFVANGSYQGPTSDAWDVYDLTGRTTSADTNYIGGSWLGGIGSDTIPGKWSGGEIEGPLDAIWIGLRKDGTLSGRRVDGGVVGNYIEVGENQGTWQAGGAGEWIEVNTNLAAGTGLDANIKALGQAANVPISVAYSSVLRGSNGPITSMTMDTHLFNMVGGGDGIWAAIIKGTYSTPPSTNWNVTVTNGANNATLSGPAWANSQWNANVSGTVNGDSITGKAGGTYGSGQFSGAGTGTFER